MAIESRETVKLHPPKQQKCKKVPKIITVTPGTATQRLTIQHPPNNISGRGNISYRGLKTTSSCYANKHTEYIYQTTHMLGGCVPFFVVGPCFVFCHAPTIFVVVAVVIITINYFGQSRKTVSLCHKF